MYELHPADLEANGLRHALHDLVERAGSEGGFSVAVDAELERHDPAFEALLYRTARELVTNVRKHASAGRLEVRLVEERDVVAGSAHDDSRGFDALDRGRTSMHVGLGTLVDRGQSAGGTVEIESHSPGGTRVEFRLPI